MCIVSVKQDGFVVSETLPIGKKLISVHCEEVALDMPKLQTQQGLYYIGTTGTTSSKPISSVVGCTILFTCHNSRAGSHDALRASILSNSSLH